MSAVQALQHNRQYPPGPPAVGSNPLAQLSLSLKFMRDPLGLIDEWHRQYGDLIHLQVGEAHQHFLAHPDDIHEVLVKQSSHFQKPPDYKDENRGLARFMGNGLVVSDGDFWKRQRKLAQPAFHAMRISNYADVMVDFTQRMVREWESHNQVDVSHQMMRLTRQIVAKTLFDTDVSQDSDRIDEVLTIFLHMGNEVDVVPTWIPTPHHIRQRRALRDMDEIMYGIIDERRTAGDDRGDLLSMLLSAQDDEGAGMTDKQVRDEAVTLFLAGHETTANALNWSWYLLAQNPEAERKLHQEIDTVLAGRTATLADLKNLPYTEMVIKESMRLLPPVWGFGRQAIDDVEIGGYPIAAGSTFSVITWLVHRDPRWWGDDALTFRPERFGTEDYPKYAYIPFGGGPRVCIGNSFAMMEAQLLLATIAQHYQLRLSPGQTVGLEPLTTLRPKGGLPMHLERRA